MKVYNYKNYEEYVQAQTETNKAKLMWVYTNKEVVRQIVKDKPFAANVLCHGTRCGAEQRYFKELLPEAEIIGTEISETAEQFEMTVKHDFTEPKEEWIGKFDIVYSNSFDHTIDPQKTITTWRDQLNNEGRLYLEYAEAQSIGNWADPLDATENEIRELISNNGLKILREIKSGVKHGGTLFVCEKV